MSVALPLLHEATLLRRYKRFLADIRLSDGTEVTAHCPNPGRMTSCWAPGARCRVSRSEDPRRKLAWTLEQVLMPDGWVLVHTGRPNAVVRDALERGHIAEVRPTRIEAERRAQDGGSRFDFRLEEDGRVTWLEVKNLTLVDEDGIGRFPDAVTERGRRHVLELEACVRRGERAILFFHVGRPGPSLIAPADDVDPAYAEALRWAASRGVEVLAYRGCMDAQELWLGERLSVDLTIRGR